MQKGCSHFQSFVFVLSQERKDDRKSEEEGEDNGESKGGNDERDENKIQS